MALKPNFTQFWIEPFSFTHNKPCLRQVFLFLFLNIVVKQKVKDNFSYFNADGKIYTKLKPLHQTNEMHDEIFWLQKEYIFYEIDKRICIIAVYTMCLAFEMVFPRRRKIAESKIHTWFGVSHWKLSRVMTPRQPTFYTMIPLRSKHSPERAGWR